MAITNFPASRWSAIVQLVAQDEPLAGMVASEVYQSDTIGAQIVKINKIDTPTIRTYVPGTPNTTEDLTDTQVDLTLDQIRYYQFKAEDHQLAQSPSVFWEPAATQAGIAMLLNRDQYLFGVNTYGNADI